MAFVLFFLFMTWCVYFFPFEAGLIFFFLHFPKDIPTAVIITRTSRMLRRNSIWGSKDISEKSPTIARLAPVKRRTPWWYWGCCMRRKWLRPSPVIFFLLLFPFLRRIHIHTIAEHCFWSGVFSANWRKFVSAWYLHIVFKLLSSCGDKEENKIEPL